MQRTAANAPTTRARAITTKEAARGIRTWLLDASIAIALIGALALATALTSH